MESIFFKDFEDNVSLLITRDVHKIPPLENFPVTTIVAADLANSALIYLPLTWEQIHCRLPECLCKRLCIVGIVIPDWLFIKKLLCH